MFSSAEGKKFINTIIKFSSKKTQEIKKEIEQLVKTVWPELKKNKKASICLESVWKELDTRKNDAWQCRAGLIWLAGYVAVTDPSALIFMKQFGAPYDDWRVQEYLAKGFDAYGNKVGYDKIEKILEEWLSDPHPNVRRAAMEGPRKWISREPFKANPKKALTLLFRNWFDPSEYARKSCHNAVEDIKKSYPEVVSAFLSESKEKKRKKEKKWKMK